jgi:CRISPR-associated protein Cmr4
MSQSMTLIWVHALSPLRIGTEEGLGAINLPTLRETHTGHPLVPGSSLKGVLRGLTSSVQPTDVLRLFGPERNNAGDHRGALRIGDARIVALPVRSLFGTFAWCTSTSVLRRVSRDMLYGGQHGLSPINTNLAAVASGSKLLDGQRIYVEDISIEKVFISDDVGTLAKALARSIWSEEADVDYFAERFCILPDSVFDALCRGAMEVRTRVCIDHETGTAEESGPWSEEAMPAETLLVSLVEGVDTVWKKRDEDKVVEREGTGDSAIGSLRSILAARSMVCLGGHTSVGYGRAVLQGAK